MNKETQNVKKSVKKYSQLKIKSNSLTGKKSLDKTFQSGRRGKANSKVVFSVCIAALLFLSILASYGPTGSSNSILSANVCQSIAQQPPVDQQTTKFHENEAISFFGNTILVPDDYPTLSDAIGNASQGDTIYVKDGIYYENPVIDKKISIIGEDSKNTIVVGSGGAPGDNVLTVRANDVEISGLTIESKSYSNSSYYA